LGYGWAFNKPLMKEKRFKPAKAFRRNSELISGIFGVRVILSLVGDCLMYYPIALLGAIHCL
jgi:hypothetical protein